MWLCRKFKLIHVLKFVTYIIFLLDNAALDGVTWFNGSVFQVNNFSWNKYQRKLLDITAIQNIICVLRAWKVQDDLPQRTSLVQVLPIFQCHLLNMHIIAKTIFFFNWNSGGNVVLICEDVSSTWHTQCH